MVRYCQVELFLSGAISQSGVLENTKLEELFLISLATFRLRFSVFSKRLSLTGGSSLVSTELGIKTYWNAFRI